MTTEEAKQLREKLQNDIRDLLKAFQRDTQIDPTGVEVETISAQTMRGRPCRLISNVVVRCEL